MIKVKLTTNFPEWPIERQTPKHSGVWGNCEFYINEPVKECDYWVVYDGLIKKEETFCPKGNTILITGEPPATKQYTYNFLKQFGTVITCHRNIKHNNPIFQQQGLPWHVGRRERNHVNLSFSKDYNELVSINHFPKDKEISVISSLLNYTTGHRQRLDFLKILKHHFGNQIDVFGRGIQEIEDKWDALARYKYHVTLENCSVEDYWSEKLADAYLSGCYPIYYGCPNIERYFNTSALTKIDIMHPEKAIHIIESCIKESKYEHVEQKIKEARMDVLNRYNLFAMICAHVNNNQLSFDRPKKIVKIQPASVFRPKPTFARRILRKIARTWRC